MKKLLLTLFILVSSVQLVSAQAQRGTITIVTRDPAGAPVQGLTIRVLYDEDDGTRPEVGTYQTNASGEIHLTDVKWGTYIVQFIALSTGQAIQPVAQQNMALLDDGSGVANGYGIHFADQSERLDLFVLDTSQTPAIPFFDQALDLADQPQAYDPHRDNPAPISTAQPQTLGEALAEHNAKQYTPTPPNVAVMILAASALIITVLLVLYGASKSPPYKPEGD